MDHKVALDYACFENAGVLPAYSWIENEWIIIIWIDIMGKDSAGV